MISINIIFSILPFIIFEFWGISPILGPNGLIKSDIVRIGLYGMLSQSEYGIRTHPAEEIYIGLAGVSYWKRGNDKYKLLLPSERSYHPSLMPHSSKTENKAFISVYVWSGNLSTDDYLYKGLPVDWKFRIYKKND